MGTSIAGPQARRALEAWGIPLSAESGLGLLPYGIAAQTVNPQTFEKV